MNKYITIILLLLGSLSFGQVTNKVGVNTSAPQATLDVNGNMIVRELESYKPGNIDLMWNKKNKRIVGRKNITPFIRINFKITCTDEQDWIEDFNTKIPSDEYTLAVLHSNFRYPEYEKTPGSQKPGNNGKWARDWETFYGISHEGDDLTNENPKETANPVKYVQVSRGNDNFWHIKADFYNGKPGLAYNSYYRLSKNHRDYKIARGMYWDIEVLAIHKSYVKDFRDGVAVGPNFYNDWPRESNNFTTSAPKTSSVIQEIIAGED